MKTLHIKDFLPYQGPTDSTKPLKLFTSWKYSFHLNYDLSITYLSTVFVYTSLLPYFFFKNSWLNQTNYLQTYFFVLFLYFLLYGYSNQKVRETCNRKESSNF